MPISTIGSNSLNQTSDLTINGQTVGKGGGNVATNTVHGVSALQANTTGSNATVVGYQAGYTTTGGLRQSFFGSQAGYYMTDENTSVGYRALYGASGSTGYYNVAVGRYALNVLTSGVNNVAIGDQALQANTTASNNTAVGYQAGYANTTGAGLVAVGRLALNTNTTGSSNTALGHVALLENTTGSYNTAVGQEALRLNTTADSNTAVGYQALYTNTATQNTAIGTQAGYSNTTGVNNAFIGRIAGYAVTTGSRNTCVGDNAGSYSTDLVTGSNNTYVGFRATASSSSVSNELVVATTATFGKGANTGYIFGSGGVYQGNNSSSWSTTSDIRLKKNVVDNTDGLDKIVQIRVRNFEYRTAEEVTELPKHTVIDKQGVQLGVIAQELQEILPDCVKEQSTGVISVDSDNIFWYMVNAIKDLKAELDTVKAELAALKG